MIYAHVEIVVDNAINQCRLASSQSIKTFWSVGMLPDQSPMKYLFAPLFSIGRTYFSKHSSSFLFFVACSFIRIARTLFVLIDLLISLSHSEPSLPSGTTLNLYSESGSSPSTTAVRAFPLKTLFFPFCRRLFGETVVDSVLHN